MLGPSKKRQKKKTNLNKAEKEMILKMHKMELQLNSEAAIIDIVVTL